MLWCRQWRKCATLFARLTRKFDNSSVADELIDMCIKNGVDVNAQDFFGETALHRCLSSSDRVGVHSVFFLQKLLASGANPNIENQKRETALSAYVSSRLESISVNASKNKPYDATDLSRCLQNSGANFNKIHHVHDTSSLSLHGSLLYLACLFDDIELAQILLSCGANPNISCGRRDDTIIAMAIHKQDWGFVEKLRQCGAFAPDPSTKEGNMLQRYLSQHGKQAHVVAATGQTGYPLQEACNRAIIIVDDKISVDCREITTGAILSAVNDALTEEAAPIILSHETLENAVDKLAGLMDSWLIFGGEEVPQGFYLLIPKIAAAGAISSAETLALLGFDPSLKLYKKATFVRQLTAIRNFSNVKVSQYEPAEFQHLFLSKNAAAQAPKPFNIFLLGHGLPLVKEKNWMKAYAAGFDIPGFKRCLQFFNDQIAVANCCCFTCYGGANLLAPYYDDHGNPLVLNFNMVHNAIIATPLMILNCIDKPWVCSSLKFSSFFTHLNQSTAQANGDSLQEAYRAIIPVNGAGCVLMRRAGSCRFEPLPLSDDVHIVDQASATSDIVLTQQRKALLIYPSIVAHDITVQNDDELFKIISMDPRANAFHFIKSLTMHVSLHLPMCIEDEVVKRFSLGDFAGKTVYFVIPLLKIIRGNSCSEYRNVIISFCSETVRMTYKKHEVDGSLGCYTYAGSCCRRWDVVRKISEDDYKEEVDRSVNEFRVEAQAALPFIKSLPDQTDPEAVIKKVYEMLQA